MATNSVAAMTNKAVNRPIPTLAETALPPSTERAGNLVEASKLVKDAQFIALYDPVAHLRLNQYIPGHWLGKAING